MQDDPLTLEKELSKVAPKKFVSTLQWFIEKQGEDISLLIMCQTKWDLPFNISVKSGIFSPSDSDIHYKNKRMQYQYTPVSQAKTHNT